MDKQRARTRTEKEYRKTKILESAKKLFQRYGFRGTKIQMITNDAGLSPAAFYLYFKNKLEIYRALSIEGTQILTGKIEQALKSDHANFTDKISAVADAYYSFFNTHREYYDIITIHHLGHEEFFNNTDMAPRLEEQSRHLLKLLSEIIQKGVQTKEFRPCDPWETSAVLWGMMDGILILQVRKTTDYIKVDIDQLTKRFLELVLYGLRLESNNS